MLQGVRCLLRRFAKRLVALAERFDGILVLGLGLRCGKRVRLLLRFPETLFDLPDRADEAYEKADRPESADHLAQQPGRARNAAQGRLHLFPGRRTLLAQLLRLGYKPVVLLLGLDAAREVRLGADAYRCVVLGHGYPCIV